MKISIATYYTVFDRDFTFLAKGEFEHISLNTELFSFQCTLPVRITVDVLSCASSSLVADGACANPE